MDGSPDGGAENESGSGVERSTGKGGRKLGMCGGGFQLSVRGRFRVGDVGLDTGDNGKGGVDRGRGGVNCRPPVSWETEVKGTSLPLTMASVIVISSSSSSSSSPSSSERK